jgi:hypothetical protein
VGALSVAAKASFATAALAGLAAAGTATVADSSQLPRTGSGKHGTVTPMYGPLRSFLLDLAPVRRELRREISRARDEIEQTASSVGRSM